MKLLTLHPDKEKYKADHIKDISRNFLNLQ